VHGVDVPTEGVPLFRRHSRATVENSVQLLPTAPIFPSAAMTSRHNVRFTGRTRRAPSPPFSRGPSRTLQGCNAPKR
jgi:hypothetical protein